MALDVTLAMAQRNLTELREKYNIPLIETFNLDGLLDAYEEVTGNPLVPDEYEKWLQGEIEAEELEKENIQ